MAIGSRCRRGARVAAAALNVGAAVGPVLGAVVAPVWMAAALVAMALVVAVGLGPRRRR
ncbi:hypothetical protein ACIOD2_22410 [Amycolatopsis sp. NPDC088138]|uniref:hypothetical protein n=1 Tax=Amycolatopsis sp. NPDC088138 TaxID=3363938 RepID=UPI003829B375